MSISLTVAIIAGGKSRRFGSPKALAEFHGKRLIDHAVSLAQQLSENVFVCCGSAPLPLDSSIQQLPDLFQNCGPIGGLHAAFESCETERIAIIPCDMPLVTANIYKTLLENDKHDQPVVAVSERGVQPLVSIWPVSARGSIELQMATKRYGLHALLKHLDAIEVVFNTAVAERQFRNVNTLADLRAIDDSNFTHETS
ncbi:MAG: molybdenum cofactor guanylyltransferase [Calditrichia bacterium]